VEDKLQEGVPEAISVLHDAGIAIWMLTGDMQNTAINIAYSCNLLNDEMEQFILEARDTEECGTKLKSFADSLKDSKKVSALVVQGSSLAKCFTPQLEKLFYQVSSQCEIVICCRVSPNQKGLSFLFFSFLFFSFLFSFLCLMVCFCDFFFFLNYRYRFICSSCIRSFSSSCFSGSKIHQQNHTCHRRRSQRRRNDSNRPRWNRDHRARRKASNHGERLCYWPI